MAVEEKKSVAESLYETLPSADDVLQATLSSHQEEVESLLKVIAEHISSVATNGGRTVSIHLGEDTSALLADTAVDALGARGYEVDVWRLPRKCGTDLDISW